MCQLIAEILAVIKTFVQKKTFLRSLGVEVPYLCLSGPISTGPQHWSSLKPGWCAAPCRREIRVATTIYCDYLCVIFLFLLL